jgi:membrane-bound ClpP family serine protease
MYEIMLKLANPLGILGVVLILIGYFLLSTNRWSAHSIRFQLANFVGAWLILYSLFFYWNLSSVIIEVAWILISLVGMVRIIKERKKQRNI